MDNEQANLEINSKDLAVKYRGSALCLLILACITGIVIVAIYVTDKTVKYPTIFFMFLGMMQLINILAATLGLEPRD